MKYKNLKLSIFAMLVSISITVQAFSWSDYFNNDNDDLAQEEVAAPVQQKPKAYDDLAQEEVAAPVQQKPEAYQMGRSEQHDQWILQCAKGSVSGNEKCNLIHKINDKLNQQIIKIEVIKDATGNMMLFHLPLGAYLPAGAVLMVGEASHKMPITVCVPAGCQARIALDWNLNQKFKREDKAIVQLLNVNQKQKINIEFSLMGYSKGSKEIK